jgi:hypothetical protein
VAGHAKTRAAKEAARLAALSQSDGSTGQTSGILGSGTLVKAPDGRPAPGSGLTPAGAREAVNAITYMTKAGNRRALRDELAELLAQEHPDRPGVHRARVVAEAMVNQAEAGNVRAFIAIADRVDGVVTPAGDLSRPLVDVLTRLAELQRKALEAGVVEGVCVEDAEVVEVGDG